MKHRLENNLADMNTIESQLESVVFTLELLKEHFEFKNQMDLFHMTQLLYMLLCNNLKDIQDLSTRVDHLIMHTSSEKE